MISAVSYEMGPEVITEEAVNYLPDLEVEKALLGPPLELCLGSCPRYFAYLCT